MPIGICLPCQRRFVVEEERSFQRTCPGCLHPMELPGAASLTALVPLSTAFPTSPPGELGVRWLNDTPVAADELGQRLMTALAQAADERERARRQRLMARELRRKEKGEPAAAELSPVSLAGAAMRGAQTEPGPVNLLRKARAVCLEARMTVGQVRVGREKRQFSRDPLSLLPPLEYKLLSPHTPLPPLWEPAGADVDYPEAPPASPPLLPASSTALYVWGYQPPESSLCRDQCAATEAAAQVARENEWEAARPGAWAKEVRLGLSLTEMLRLVVPILRRDPGVDGWQMSMRRGEYFPIDAEPDDGEP
jgi:hypothetical protein